MTEASIDLVKKQLLEVPEQMVRVTAACKNHKDVLEEELDSIKKWNPYSGKPGSDREDSDRLRIIQS